LAGYSNAKWEAELKKNAFLRPIVLVPLAVVVVVAVIVMVGIISPSTLGFH
jgi:hypothetical protein